MKKLLVFLACSILVFMTALLMTAGIWLNSSDPVSNRDVIVVLAGDFSRSFYAADLYRDHVADKIWLSVPAQEAMVNKIKKLGIPLLQEAEISMQILLKSEVPSDKIETFGSGSLSTVEEAKVLQKKLSGQNKSLLIVTSPYHVFRTRLIFSRMLPTTKLTVVATPYEFYPTKWWQDQGAARNTILELTKLVYYFVGGKFISAGTAY